MTDPRRPVFEAIRAARGAGFGNDEVSSIDALLDQLGVPRTAPVLGEPPWLAEARKDLGLAEVPGARHSPRILQMLTVLSYPFRDDETPWCGTAMAAWMKQVGIEPPPLGFRALSWAGWGTACPVQLGAVGIKQRKGGNHVFLIVGETPDKRFFKALGANQGNRVSIVDIAKADTFAVRWPAAIPLRGLALPVMAAGTISGSEA